MDVPNLEGDFSAEADAVERVGLRRDAGPVAHAQSARVKFSVGAESDPVYAGCESLHEGKDRALPLPIDLFERHTKDTGIQKLTDKHLSLKRSEAAVRDYRNAACRTNPCIRK